MSQPGAGARPRTLLPPARCGCRSWAWHAAADGLAGTEIAIDAGVDTIEHGMYLHRRPDLLERMGQRGHVLVPTLSCFYGVAGLEDDGGHAASTWSALLVELARHNLEHRPTAR